MFNFFKKKSIDNLGNNDSVEFNFELVGCALAYEVAKADGAIGALKMTLNHLQQCDIQNQN